MTRVEYLGYIIEGGTIKPSDRKVIMVAQFPEPTSTKAVQSFLGLTVYFCEFIPHYTSIARLLSQLLKTETKFTFGVEQKQIFEQLKTALKTDSILKLYKMNIETEFHTDAIWSWNHSVAKGHGR